MHGPRSTFKWMQHGSICGSAQEWLGRHKLDRAALQRLKDNYEGHTAWLAWQQAQEEAGDAGAADEQDAPTDTPTDAPTDTPANVAEPEAQVAQAAEASAGGTAVVGGTEPEAAGPPETGGSSPAAPEVDAAAAETAGPTTGNPADAPKGAKEPANAATAAAEGDAEMRDPQSGSVPPGGTAADGDAAGGGQGETSEVDGAAGSNAAAAGAEEAPAAGEGEQGKAEAGTAAEEEGPEIMPEQWGLWKARSRAVVPLGSEPGRFSYEFPMVHVLLEFRNALALPRRKGDPASWVGCCVRVFWPEDGLWYSADVVAWRPQTGTHVLLYHADDEEEELDLMAEERQRRLQWLRGADSASWPPPPHPPLPLGRPPTARLSNGGMHLQNADTGVATAHGARGENGQRAERDALGAGELAQVKQEGGAEVWGADGGPADARGTATGVPAGVPPSGEAAVGWRVEVFWEEGDIWCKGLVETFEEHLHRHKVHFDDGDMQWVDCSMCPVRWLKADAQEEAAEERRKAAATASKAAAEALATAQAEAAERARSAPDAVDIVCNGRRAQLLVRETAVVMENGSRVSPTEFERLSGKGAAKKWKVCVLHTFNCALMSLESPCAAVMCWI